MHFMLFIQPPKGMTRVAWQGVDRRMEWSGLDGGRGSVVADIIRVASLIIII